MDVLAEVHAVIGEVGRGLAARKRTQGELAWSAGPCGAPPASVLLPATATYHIPQHRVSQGCGAAAVVVFSRGEGGRGHRGPFYRGC
jgi:hypothetical protein